MQSSSAYPREIWRGNTPKSSQLYRCVIVDWDTFVFEAFGGKDAMGADTWKGLSDVEDSNWYSIALAMAFTISKVAVYKAELK